jgi:xanthine dehydrogenase accessory factor
MKMLVDPVRNEADFKYYRRLLDQLATDEGCTEAVILDPEKAGGSAADRFLLNESGVVIATTSRSPNAHVRTIGNDPIDRTWASGLLPPTISQQLRPLAQRPRPYVAEGVSFLPQLRRCRLVIVGAGHVGQKVGELAAACDFDVWAVDDREQYCNAERFPHAKRLIVGEIDTLLSGLDVDHNTYCLIVTRGHQHDEEALYHLAETPARYVGMIGSQRKIKMIFEDLLRDGISREALSRVYAPLGFDIGSQTVPEIAVSIVAELIAHRNLGELPERFRRPSLLDSQAASPT